MRREREKIRELVAGYCSERELDGEISEYSSAEEYLEDAADADILLLDEEMPGMSGVALKDMLFRKGSVTQIIFVTSHDEIMREAYGGNVFGFLEKPVDKAWFYRKMDEALYSIRMYGKALEEASDYKSSMYIDDVLYIETDDKITEVYYTDGSVKKGYETLDSYNQNYPDDLFVIHKSYVINLKYAGAITNKKCVKITTWSLIPKN